MDSTISYNHTVYNYTPRTDPNRQRQTTLDAIAIYGFLSINLIALLVFPLQ